MKNNARATKHIITKESDLFPIIKKSFNGQGYKVFAEVACNYRGVDMVAAKGDEHVAIELKTSFNSHLLTQASWNTHFFDKVYVAYPVREAILFHVEDVFWKLRESTRDKYSFCEKRGVGILQVLPTGMIYEALEPTQQKPFRKLDLQHYVETDEDFGGVPHQKGVSEGYHELESIKKYVIAHPDANWKEIYENVPTHYSSANSLSGSMSQWRGFYLTKFKKTLGSAQMEKNI